MPDFEIPAGYEYNRELTAEEHKRVVANTHAPGEKVRVNMKVSKEAIADLVDIAQANDGLVEVEAVVVEDSYVYYRVKGVEGLYGGNALIDARNFEHCYGAILCYEDELWVADLENSDRAFKVEGAPEVHVRWSQGVETYDDLYKLVAEMDGAAGEFNVIDNGPAGWSLNGIPWWADLSEDERSKAVDAIASHKASLANLGI